MNKSPTSLVPSSESTTQYAPPPSGPTSVIDAPPASNAERTVVRPPRAAPPAGFRAPIDGSHDSASIPTPHDVNDPWTAEFTDGDMEGPTVATTETPAFRSLPSLPRPVTHASEATQALHGHPVTRAASGMAAPGPAHIDDDAKRTMRLDSTRGRRRRRSDAASAVHAVPVRRSGRRLDSHRRRHDAPTAMP